MEFAQVGIDQLASERPAPSRLSFSAFSDYVDCSEKFRLSRTYKLPEKFTYYATVAGGLIHEITAEIDLMVLNGADYAFALMMKQGDFEGRFELEVARLTGEGVEVKASGPKREKLSEAGGPNKKDHDWWMTYGPKFIERWCNWVMENNFVILNEDGMVGVELEVAFSLDETPVVGSIDRLGHLDGELVVIDLKFGTREQESDIQPLTYALAVKEQFGVTVGSVAFWKPSVFVQGSRTEYESNGGLKDVVSVSNEDLEFAASIYPSVDRGIKHSIFLPSPNANCRFCTMEEYCRARKGRHAEQVPLVTKITPRNAGNPESNV